jgi:hypothetical protein
VLQLAVLHAEVEDSNPVNLLQWVDMDSLYQHLDLDNQAGQVDNQDNQAGPVDNQAGPVDNQAGPVDNQAGLEGNQAELVGMESPALHILDSGEDILD